MGGLVEGVGRDVEFTERSWGGSQRSAAVQTIWVRLGIKKSYESQTERRRITFLQTMNAFPQLGGRSDGGQESTSRFSK
jgi:hypothetical protein